MNLSHYDDALRIFKEVETVQKETLGQRHENYLITKENIGECLKRMTESDEPLHIFEMSKPTSEVEDKRKGCTGVSAGKFILFIQ